MKNKKIIIFSAPSGSGKTSIIYHLLQEMNKYLNFSVSCTTRIPRKNEINGKDYYFLSLKLFKKKIIQNDFIEWEEVYPGCFYGTLKSEIERLWLKSKNIIFDIDVKGGLNLKSLYPNQSLTIFIQPPSLKELEKRLYIRSNKIDKDFQIRLKKAKIEMNYAKNFDKILINDNFLKVLYKVKKIIKNFIF